MSAWCFNELVRHVGHDIVCVAYGPVGEPYNVAIECKTCMEVLLDYDAENPVKCEQCGKPIIQRALMGGGVCVDCINAALEADEYGEG